MPTLGGHMAPCRDLGSILTLPLAFWVTVGKSLLPVVL